MIEPNTDLETQPFNWTSARSFRGLDASAAAPRSKVSTEHLLGSVHELIGEELDGVEATLQQAVNSRHREVQVLSQQAASMGGKRLRPMLVLLSAAAIPTTSAGLDKEWGRRRRVDTQSIAGAVELVHAASLVHDDVMDRAEQRRHRPTIMAQAGNSTAILLGDYLFTRAYALAAACRSTLPARRIADAAALLCEGELRQQMSIGNWELSLKEYRSILLQKTGALCGVSCQLGAWAGQAPREYRRALFQYGNMLGLAFQIYDDWLDYWGTDQVGKTLGTDFAQRKPTLPVLHLLNDCDPTQRELLLAQLDGCAASPTGDSPAQLPFPGLLDQLQEAGSSNFTLQVAEHCVRRAKQSLDCIPDSRSKTLLFAIADYSIARKQ
ncbi:polyprenyl synthetase family protein [Aureliella helgolandensis]|uniref:Octaprenyl-diphosphate synthase n=1 Tax=Aureliella helgolandensis TaxID=2527968 RepID=A0A518GDF0_9BACT|nr:polyprenyl synthetase family protein [Aureliella helgolandensis]QDV26622.1 Octaprenyl-diphosphate synthase [Aureliella helgolandensis]